MTNSTNVSCSGSGGRDLRNSLRYLLAIFVWAIFFTGGSQLIKRGLLAEGPAVWIVALLPTIAAIFVVLAYLRFLREADELQRIIQLKALAIGFGGTFFAVSGYRMLERAGAPPADLGDFTLVMAVLFSLGSVLGTWYYR